MKKYRAQGLEGSTGIIFEWSFWARTWGEAARRFSQASRIDLTEIKIEVIEDIDAE